MGLYFYDALQTSSLSQSLLFAWTFWNMDFYASGLLAGVTSTTDWGPNRMTSTFYARSDVNSAHASGNFNGYYRTASLSASQSMTGTEGGWSQFNGASTRMDMPSFSSSFTGAFNAVSASAPFTIITWFNPATNHTNGTKYALVAKWNGSASSNAFGGWALLYASTSSTGFGSYDYPILYFTASVPVSGYLAYSGTGVSGTTDWLGEGPTSNAALTTMRSIAVTYDGSGTTSSTFFYRNGYCWSSGGFNQVINSQTFSITSSITGSPTCTIGTVGTLIASNQISGPTFMWTRVLTPAEIATVADPQLIGTTVLHTTSSQISTQDASGTSIHVTVQLSPVTVDASTAGNSTALDPRVSKVNPGTN